MKKAPPPDPHRENFNNLGHGVGVYKCTEILYLLVVWNHRGAPPNGTLLPNRRLVSAWLFDTHVVRYIIRYIICLIIFVIIIIELSLSPTDVF